jgi:hypothetical protein
MFVPPTLRTAHGALRRRHPLAVATALLAILALVAGAVGFHADGADHAVAPTAAAAGATTVQACAGDHAPREHYERQRPVERDACAACLHRLLHQADHGPDATPTAHAVVAAAPPAPRFELRQVPLDRSPSRGPPAV